jgi:hypothetical protein
LCIISREAKEQLWTGRRWKKCNKEENNDVVKTSSFENY